MQVVVTLEQRFFRTPDGVVWTPSAFDHRFWRGYLDVFSEVRVVARLGEVPEPRSAWRQASGVNVAYTAVPYYVGPSQYATKLKAVRRAVRSAVGAADAVILRVGSHIAGCVRRSLAETSHPYGVEVVGDPYEVFAAGAVKHPLRPLLRWWFSRQLRQQCAEACAAAYVTREALQKRYPPGPATHLFYYSSAALGESSFAPSARQIREEPNVSRLVTVASLEQPYKGTDLLIDAMSRCVSRGRDIRLVVVGGGKYLPALRRRAQRSGLGDRVAFRGALPAGDAVRSELDAADLFVLPSRTEGLPRAMLEAMARGLPCIGSHVGGIPELLPSEDMVPPADAGALADKMCEVLASPGRLETMSSRNLAVAREYREDLLADRRRAFCRCLKEHTQAWLDAKRN